jgi:hypothetical protein
MHAIVRNRLARLAAAVLAVAGLSVACGDDDDTDVGEDIEDVGEEVEQETEDLGGEVEEEMEEMDEE